MKTIQIGFRFTEETVQKLKELSRFHNRSQANMVEIMVDQEHARMQRLRRVAVIDMEKEGRDGDNFGCDSAVHPR